MSSEKMMAAILQETPMKCRRLGFLGASIHCETAESCSRPASRLACRIDIVILNPALQEKSPFANPPSAPAAVQSQLQTPVNPSAPPASSAPTRQ